MIRLSWKITTGSVAAASALLVFSWACGGGGNRGPTAPSFADVSGEWSGRTTLEAASGCGCLSDNFADVIGIDKYTVWDISQNGAAIQGRFWDDWFWSWCDVTGTVGSESFHAESTSCEQEEVERTCDENGVRRDLVLASISWQGTVGDIYVTGNWVMTWDCFNPRNGKAKGALTLGGPFSIHRGATVAGG